MRFVLGVQYGGREEAEVGHRARNVEATREREWLACIDRLCAREFFQIALDQVGDAQKNLRSFCCSFFRPIGEGFLRRGHGKIDIARVAVRYLRIRLAGCRLDVVEILAADRLDKSAIDEVLNSAWFGG